jgi:hypothetical protein
MPALLWSPDGQPATVVRSNDRGLEVKTCRRPVRVFLLGDPLEHPLRAPGVGRLLRYHPPGDRLDIRERDVLAREEPAPAGGEP